jgi:hypothetical protein
MLLIEQKKKIVFFFIVIWGLLLAVRKEQSSNKEFPLQPNIKLQFCTKLGLNTFQSKNNKLYA